MGDLDGTIARSGQTDPCTCGGRVVTRSQPRWSPGATLYGYGVSVTVRAHMGACPLPDEVISARAVLVEL